MSNVQEQWQSFVGFDGMYEVSDLGNARSLKGGKVTPLKFDVMSNGYRRVRLFKDGRQHRRLIHRAILEAFIGPRPGMKACHNNGIRADNRLDNLRWDTQRGNLADRIAHGTDPAGERNGRAKLTEDDIREIRRLALNGHTERSLAKRFGVWPGTIHHIKSRKLWSHVA